MTQKVKRRFIIGLVTFVGFIACYIFLRFVFGFFTPYNSYTAYKDIKDGQVKIIYAGEIPLNFIEKQDLAHSYGFSISLPSCNMTQDVLNGINFYNKQVIEHLQARNGHNWWTKFQNQVDSIDRTSTTANIIQHVVNVVSQQLIVKRQIRLIDSLSNSTRRVTILPILDDSVKNTYLVKVGEDNGTNLVVYYNFLVDATRMKVMNPSGKLPE